MVSRRLEQLRLHVQHRVVTTTEDSVLWTEMTDLEPQEENVSRRDLWFKSMSCLVQIRTHRRDESWSAVL